MTVFDFNSVQGTSTAFAAASDILVLSGDAADFRFSESGSDLVVTKISSGEAVTLTGASQEQLVGGTNLLFTGSDSTAIFGDATTATTTDNLANTIGLPTNPDENSIVYGLGGADAITVGNGDNVVFGGSGVSDSTDGADTIIIEGTAGTTSGNNLVYGNGGNDDIDWDNAGVSNNIGAGKTATVYGGAGDDSIGAANDVHIGNGLFYGNGDEDTINFGTASTGDVTIYGGSGAVDSTDGGDTIGSTGIGNATVYGNAGDDNITTSAFISGKAQTVYAGLGADSITASASAGDLTAYGNAGADIINITAHIGDVTVYGGNGTQDTTDGADTITFGAASATANATIYANAGDDTITSTAALAAAETAVIYGGLGADTFNISGARAATSNLSLYGNEGDDIFNINDTALAANATLAISGFEATDEFNITLQGGSDSAADLTITGMGSTPTIVDATNGTYAFTGYTGNFTASNFVISDGSYLLTNYGGSATTLAGTTIAGGDHLIAGDNGDTLTGDAGTDKLTGGAGADSIAGGADADTIDGAAGNDTITSGDGAADSIDGGTGNDSITGGTGTSTINGDAGNDTIVGGTGQETIDGGAGDDVITSTSSADSDDSLTGGTGADTFNYVVADTDATKGDVDIISDFTNGTDIFDFTDLTVSSLHGDGSAIETGDANTDGALGTNTGLYLSNAAAASIANVAGIDAEINASAAFQALGADILYAIISDNTNAVLVRVTDANDNNDFTDAGDVLFVATLSGLTAAEVAALTTSNFADW